MTYYYVGVIVALSLIRGGPAPHFFSSAVADYIVRKVNTTADDVPNYTLKQSLMKVCGILLYKSPNMCILRNLS